MNAWAAGSRAFERARAIQAYAFLVGVVKAKEQPHPIVEPSSVEYRPTTTATPTVPIAQPTSGGVWICIANAETSNGRTMSNGPVYFTEFGMVRDIIEDYGTPEEQAAVFGGYASFGQQLDIATRFAAENGFGGWGWRTREKCSL